MSDMLKSVAKKAAKELIDGEYNHLKHPSIVLASVERVNENGSLTIRILERNGNINKNYPAIPDLKTAEVYKEGELIVCALLYGELSRPYIIGRYHEYSG